MGFRFFSFLGFLGAAGAMAFALYLEHFQGLEPCPLCIFQRVAMIAAGLVFLLAALHGPGGGGRVFYALLVWITAGAGAGVAARHVWLQSLPPDQVPSCGPPLDYLMETLPAWDWITTVLRGDGDCALVDWQWLGLSLPAWTLLGFAALMLWAVIAVWAGRDKDYF